MGCLISGRWLRVSCALSFSAVLAACGGGGGGGGGTTGGSSTTTVTGLSMPSSMSVVSVREPEVAPASIAPAGSYARIQTVASDSVAGFGAESDYLQDPQQAHVFDPSMESLETVNMILCLMDQTEAERMVNQGAYYALVDENKCEQGQNQSRSGTQGQSSATQGKEYDRWVIDSRRVDNDSPMVVRIWVPGSDSPDAEIYEAESIKVQVTATEGVSEERPFGAFSLDFEGVVDGGLVDGGTAGTEVTLMRGNLRTVANAGGLPQFEFVSLSGSSLPDAVMDPGFGRDEKAVVVLDDADGNSGRARTEFSESFTDTGSGQTFSQGQRFDIAFDETHFLREAHDTVQDQADAPACASRQDFDSNVWRYRLYHENDGVFGGESVTAGERVQLNSGFPFRYTDSGSGKVRDGYVGYWGVWVDGDQTLSDGTVVEQLTHGEGEAASYVVHKSAGRLTRRSAVTRELSSLAGETLQAWDLEHSVLGMAQDNGYEQWQVTVGSDGGLTITHGQSWGESGPVLTDVADDPVAPAGGQQIWMWSDSLGGDVVVTGGSSSATFYSRETVTPGDPVLASPLSLTCYDRCLKGGLTAADVDDLSVGESALYHDREANAQGPFGYTVQVSNGRVELVDDANGLAVDATTLNLADWGHDWGISTGSMVTDEVGAGINNPWEVYNAATSYSWETGPNDWNREVTVTEQASGEAVHFDQPLRFTYQLAVGDERNGDPNGKTGRTYMLEYGGSGDLWGLPWVDAGGEMDRWYPAVNLEDGVRLSNGEGDFVVKAMEMEQTLQTAPGECGGLAVNQNLTLPTEANLGSVDFAWSDMPTPAIQAPAVIEGDLQ